MDLTNGGPHPRSYLENQSALLSDLVEVAHLQENTPPSDQS